MTTVFEGTMPAEVVPVKRSGGNETATENVQPPPAPLRDSDKVAEPAVAVAAGAGGRFHSRRVIRHWHSDSIRQLAASAVLLAGANTIGIMAPAAEAASGRVNAHSRDGSTASSTSTG